MPFTKTTVHFIHPPFFDVILVYNTKSIRNKEVNPTGVVILYETYYWAQAKKRFLARVLDRT